ncbi:hypothetical protein FA13DRAFT_1710327 [Coprinellus micaceus]|uniref:Uncharacterized protein n=1 Tax=Coprinellus micaceus TaxID=71717 RepID=A0A4Y7T9U6_COPMI|nr:hypothetical protein FA13DRAFT_1710327 [Coprinellus micaceus]
MLIGFTLNAILYGIMITQVYLYSTKYKKDPMFLKLLVRDRDLAISSMAEHRTADTVNTIFDFMYLYNGLILKFGDMLSLEKADWLFATDPAITGIIATTVQLFFAWRIRVLTKNWLFVGLVASLAVAGVVGSIVTAWEVGRTPNFVDFRNFKVVVILWLASESLGDILITAILVTYLWKRHKTGFKNSDMIVDRIIRGLLTSLVAILDLVFFLADPNGTLNSRKGWRISSETQDSARPLTEESFHVNSCPVSTTASTSAGSQVPSYPKGSPTSSAKVPSNRPEVFVSVESQQLKDDLGGAAACLPVRRPWRHGRHDTHGTLHGNLQAADSNSTSSTLENRQLPSGGDSYQGSWGRGRGPRDLDVV